MEFHEKLQELRKQKGLTQEDVAGALFVSRTAVSKWESGRGFPSIDSLRMIAKFYDVSIDELLSTDQALTIAEQNQRISRGNLLRLTYSLLDASTIMFLFLPFFGQNMDGAVIAAPLLSLTHIAASTKILYLITVVSIALLGYITLIFRLRQLFLYKLSFCLSIVGVLVFIISPQPYAAATLFVFLLVKLQLITKVLQQIKKR